MEDAASRPRRLARVQTGRMRVTLRMVLDCSPDAAWEAVTSPAGMEHVAAPILSFRSLEPGGFPDRWPEGEHRVEVLALGLVPVGVHVLRIRRSTRRGARIQEDDGRATGGPLALLTGWRHRIAVAPAPGGRTLYRERLDVGGGPAAVLAWPALWALWQWRGARWRALAALLPLV